MVGPGGVLIAGDRVDKSWLTLRRRLLCLGLLSQQSIIPSKSTIMDFDVFV